MIFDVIIVGAGPAGSTCARLCAAAGLSTLLLDRERFPRPKPCGGALSARARDLLGISLPDGLIEQPCFGARVHYGTHTIECRKDHPLAFMVDRGRFDHYLADEAVRAGAEFRQEEQVHGLRQFGATVEAATATGTYEAAFVVGADGANSIVSRSVRPPLGRNEVMAAMTVTVSREGSGTEGRHDLLEMYYGIAPQGYGWIFPHGDRLNMGIMGLASRFSEAPQRFAAFCRTIGMPSTGARGHTIPLGGIQRPVSAGRILLAGDAAGSADPFHGEGMTYAVLSGMLAAQAVMKAVGRGAHALQSYEQAYAQKVRRELKIALRMARMLEAYPELFVTIFFGSSADLDRYLDIASGRMAYRTFQRWLTARLPAHLLRHLFRKAREWA